MEREKDREREGTGRERRREKKVEIFEKESQKWIQGSQTPKPLKGQASWA